MWKILKANLWQKTSGKQSVSSGYLNVQVPSATAAEQTPAMLCRGTAARSWDQPHDKAALSASNLLVSRASFERLEQKFAQRT